MTAPRRGDAVRAALLEAGFVVLGVILALIANEWRQDVADRHRADVALTSMVDELEANRAAVAASHDYHANLLRELAAATAGPPPIQVFSQGFVNPAQVLSTAWDTASQTGALEHIPYATVLQLSAMYERQDEYRNQAHTIGPIIYGEMFRGGAQAIVENYRNLASIIQTFLYREAQLIAAYDTTLDLLRDERATSAPASSDRPSGQGGT
jgi:hypothetical protein